MSDIRIDVYKPCYKTAFVGLNREWIEKYFRLEPMDLAQLENPESSILDKGGEILFAIDGNDVVGTCALVPHGKNSYELAKMAVSPARRGAGIGDVLMQAALDWAKLKGARHVTLLSNTILEPAIGLYRKHGFRVLHLGPHPDYDRCDIEMEIDLGNMV